MSPIAEFSSKDHQEFGLRIDIRGFSTYAYFVSDGRITGLVWLLNHVRGVMTLEQIEAPPNPFTNQDRFLDTRPRMSDFQVTWQVREGVVECGIYLEGDLVGVLGDGDRPGWARFATQDSPVARKLLGD